MPGVGQNLHNHVGVTLQFTLNEPDVPELSWDTAMQYMMNRDGPLSGTGMSQVCINQFDTLLNDKKMYLQ